MSKVTLSPKYQIVIPKEVRENMGLSAGMKFEVFNYGNSISIVPIKPMKEMRGFLKGMDPTFEREKVDREI